jgi:NTE family protein
MGNPVLFPFIYETETDDVVLIQINPIERTETPRTSQEIANRIDEITFNASLLREFRAIDFVRRLIEEGSLAEDEYRALRMHRVEAAEELLALSASTKQNTEPGFLDYLFGLGRKSADKWLEEASDKVGHEPGIDLEKEIGYTLDADVPENVGGKAKVELKTRPARLKPKKARKV